MAIYVSSLSLRLAVDQSGRSLKSLPAFIRQLGFDGLEISDRELVVVEHANLQRLGRQCRRVQCGLILDVNADLTYRDRSRWQRERTHVLDMLQLGAELGIERLRIALGGQTLSIHKLLRRRGSYAHGRKPRHQLRATRQRWVKRLWQRVLPPLAYTVRRQLSGDVAQLEIKTRRALEALGSISRRAGRNGQLVGIENHWGITCHPSHITRIIETLDSPHVGACPDFGNFPQRIDAYTGLQQLMPKAVIVHAKLTRPLDAHFERCLHIVAHSGYHGPVTVECEASGRRLELSMQARRRIAQVFRRAGI